MSNSDVSRGRCCDSYAPGHNCHVISTTHANSDPTAWFPATVTALEQDEATVEYEDGSNCRLWRHSGFDTRVIVGTAVLVCERWSLVSVPGSSGRDQLSVEIRNPTWRKNGLPEDRPRPWRAGIVNLATGEGVAVQRYRVLVDDNYHYQDADERYESGVFDSYVDALAKCKEIVEECLREQLKPGMTPDELYHMYVMFGEDPWIPETPADASRFSAWEYARTRSREICGPGSENTGST